MQIQEVAKKTKKTREGLVKPGRSLAERAPEVAALWHPKLNGDLLAEQISYGSNVLVWWQCAEKHKWQQTVRSQVRNSGCSVCSGFYVSEKNSLAANFPELAKEWHSKKNRKLWFESGGTFKILQNQRIPKSRKERNRRLTPSDVAINSGEVVWWKCLALNHVWQQAVDARVESKQGCPECEKIAFATEKCLAVTHPGVSKLWHPGRNKLTPADVTAGSRRVAWWRCPKNASHVWDARVHVVVRSHKEKSHGCPICTGRRVELRNSLEVKCPEAAKFWHPTLNPIRPSEITSQSKQRAYWRCKANPPHEWDAVVANVVNVVRKGHAACPVCSKLRKNKVDPGKSLKDVYPEIAAMWDSKKNGALTPADVLPGSNKVVHWICRDFKDHGWTTCVNKLVNLNKRGGKTCGCPLCHGLKPSSENNLLVAYPGVVRYWDVERNAPLMPRDVTPMSGKNVWWRCSVHQNYRWQTRVSGFMRTIKSNLDPCKYCR